MVNMCLYRYLYISALAAALAVAQGKPRARAVGVRLEGTPGPLNAITDVKGVEAGHTTLISGDSVRTGVTVVWPRGKASGDPVYGGFYAQNGNGEFIPTIWALSMPPLIPASTAATASSASTACSPPDIAGYGCCTGGVSCNANATARRRASLGCCSTSIGARAKKSRAATVRVPVAPRSTKDASSAIIVAG